MKKIFLLVPLIIQCFSVFSQGKKETYKGEFIWDNIYKGRAVYDFYRDRSGNEIPDGRFEFIYKFTDSTDLSILNKIEIEGTYKEGKKNGLWMYLDAEHRVHIKDVVDFEIKADLESTVIKTRANYRENIPDGEWSYQVKKSTANDLSETASFDKIQFQSGYIINNFKYKYLEGSQELQIHGYLDEKGCMDSLWTIQYILEDKVIDEHRKYQNGFLLNIKILDLQNGSLINEVHFTNTKSKLESLKAGENVDFSISENNFGILYNEGFRRKDEEYRAQINGNELIRNVLKSILKNDRETYFPVDDFKVHPIKTRRFEYKIDKSYEKMAKETSELFERLSTKVDEKADWNALRLNKNKTDSLAFSFEFFQLLQKKLDLFENIIGIISSEEISYLDESVYTRNGLEYLQPFDTVHYTFEGDVKRKVIDHRIVIEDEVQLVNSILDYLTREEKIVDQLTEYVDSQLTQIELGQNVEELEAKILSEYTKTEILLQDISYVNADHKELIDHLELKFLNKKYESLSTSYSRADNYADKVSSADKMMDLLNEFSTWVPMSNKVFTERKEIDELYLENIFNPFTYTSYDQRAKERLYKNGNEKLLNHYLSLIEEEENYMNVKNHFSKVHKLHDRMRELRELDTRKIEGKLRRNNSVSNIESLLSL